VTRRLINLLNALSQLLCLAACVPRREAVNLAPRTTGEMERRGREPKGPAVLRRSN
jgi:hypothetical protein